MLTGIRSARAKSRRELVAAALAALFLAVVYSLAIWTQFGQEMENELFQRDRVPAATAGVEPVPTAPVLPVSPAPAILPVGQAAVWGGVLLLIPLVGRKPRLALWGLVTLTGSAATAFVLKELLPRPLLDNSYGVGLSAENSAPSGHATMATSVALVALVVCPAALRYIAAAAGVAVAAVTAYSVQAAGWHRPSDILMGATLSLLWVFLAALLVPAEKDIAAVRWNPPMMSLCVLAAAAVALWWVSESQPGPGYPVVVSAAAPCAAAVLLAHHRFCRPAAPGRAARTHAEGRSPITG
ncbi:MULTISPECIES: phosphatase PAP2 family protein [unclassified Streptomyces]|uniref:phosphatase PAP2 family protein n=1 Tax=unclassified Streptomyces TaxID=2593676 RepID=UPI00344C1FEE